MLHRLSPWNWLFLFLCLPMLNACSSYSPDDVPFGMSRNELVAHLGQPDRERQMDAGSRLEYKRGAISTQTWFIYVDATGKVIRTDQVLTPLNFSRVDVGMTQEAVLLLLGKPSDVRTIGQEGGALWSYRYQNSSCNWFQVELSAQQQVRSAGYRTLPECNSSNRAPIN